jgi:hypothetical protein
MSKSNYDISHQLHVDLIEAYKRVSPHCWTQHEAYERMVKEPAPRYYVSAKQAYQVIAPMTKGDFDLVNLMIPMRRRMYYSIFETFMRMSEQRQFVGKSLYYIMQFVVLSQAPEFFITPGRAKQIRIFIKNGRLRSDGRPNKDYVPKKQNRTKKK